MPRGCYFLDIDWCLYCDDLCKFMRKENCPYFYDNGFYPAGFDDDGFELFEHEKFNNTNSKDDDKQQQ